LGECASEICVLYKTKNLQIDVHSVLFFVFLYNCGRKRGNEETRNRGTQERTQEGEHSLPLVFPQNGGVFSFADFKTKQNKTNNFMFANYPHVHGFHYLTTKLSKQTYTHTYTLQKQCLLLLLVPCLLSASPGRRKCPAEFPPVLRRCNSWLG